MARRDRHVRRLRISYQAGLWAMLAPYLVGTLALVALPALMSAGLAFTTYDTLNSPLFTGFQNFRLLASDQFTGVALRNTLAFIIVAVPLRILAALAIALLLERRRRFGDGYRASVYVPTVIPDVAYAIIWLWIFNPVYGPVNLVLGALGLPTPGWVADGATATYPILVMSLFQIGEGFIIFLAGLRGIPREYYDAGSVDGAGGLTAFRFLTLPLLMPWLVLLTFRDVIVVFQYTFTPSLVMTGGGPYYATFFVPLQVYEEAFDRFRFGTGSALMLMTFVLSGLLIVGLYLIFRARGYTGDT